MANTNKKEEEEEKWLLLLLLKAAFCHPHRLLGKPLQVDYKSLDCQICSQPTHTHTHTPHIVCLTQAHFTKCS